MKNPIIKDTFREIRKTKGRFLSIFAIVAIGVAFFAGVMGSAPTMKYNADLYFDNYNLMDYRIVSNFGITEEDVDTIRKLEGVEGVFPATSADVLVNVGNSESVVRVHAMDLNHTATDDVNNINQYQIVEGRMPEKSGEIAIEKAHMLMNDLEIGDTLTFRSGDDKELSESFKVDTYTIVGMVNSPYYLSHEKGVSRIGNGSVYLYSVIPEEDFNMEVYTEVYVTVKDAKALNSYSEEYFDFIEPITSALETLGMDRSEMRRDDILSEAQEKLDEGKKEYEEGLATFNREIKEAEQKLEDGKFDLLEGQMTLQSNKDITQLKFDNAQAEIDSGKEQLKTLKEQYEKAEKAYQDNNASAINQRNEAAKKLEEAKVVEAEKKGIADQKKVMLDALDVKKASLDLLVQEKTANDIKLVELNNELSAPGLTPEREVEIRAKIDELNKKNIENLTQQDVLKEDLKNYDTVKSDYDQAKTELDRATASVAGYQATVNTIDQSLSSARQILDALKVQIDAAEKKIAEGEKALAEGKVTAQEEFKKAEEKLAQGKLDLESGQKEFEKQKVEGEEELEEAREELVKAQNEIDQIEDGKWYILDRESHYSYMDYKGAADRMEAIALVFPVFFYLVAALVCLTTMTRMVDEQRSQIGTMKALGYPTKWIAFKYVFYAAFASLSGSLVGLAIGMFVFPGIIYTVWLMMYILPPVQFTLQLPLMVGATIASVVVTTLAAFSACYAELIETPSLLMRPKAPKMGKQILLERISFLWNRFSFTSKVTARNIFRYKKRFFMTVIGISGCTALLVAGYGVKDSISTIVDSQFSTIFKYDGTITLKDDVSETRKGEILDEMILTNEIEDAELVYSANAVAYSGKRTKDVTLTVVSDPQRFSDFVSLHTRVGQKPLSLSSSGVLITERMATDYQIKVGDDLELENEEGIRKFVKVEGIVENYVGHYVYMTSAYYKSTYDLRALNNSIFIQIADNYAHDDSLVAKAVSSIDEIDTMSFYTGIRDNFQGMIQSLNIIVVVLIVSAGALAFVVLYNLTNVNISERLREIATLKVLGFHDKEVNAYVYKENIILTLVGALFGLYLGKLLHLTIMVVVELDNLMFGRTIRPTSYFLAIVITLFFGIVVNRVMSKKLRNIPMVESLKSVE